MSFVHLDSEFDSLLEIVAKETGISAALVEKDYWVTHSLWALHQLGLEVWFKGGTSLSKGFDIIQRFSEDLDLMIEGGTTAGLPEVKSWTSTNAGPVAEREAFYGALEHVMCIPDVRIERIGINDTKVRSAEYRGHYPSRRLGELMSPNRPFVLLEVGHARVVPHEEQPITSFVHDYLEQEKMLGKYDDNRPQAVRCVHPLLTLFEKLDAMAHRYGREPMEAESFVRHYEDAAHIIRVMDGLPLLKETPQELGAELVEGRVIRSLPEANAPVLTLADPEKRSEVERAYDKIEPMFWGTRIPLDESCEAIREWVRSQGW